MYLESYGEGNEKTAQFTQDYRGEMPQELMPQMTVPQEEPQSLEDVPVFYVSREECGMPVEQELCNVSEETEKEPEIEGFPLWKRNNCPSRLFYPTKVQAQQEVTEQVLPRKPAGVISGILVLMAAFVGVVCFCQFGGVNLVQDTAEIREFLTPVLMQNPQTFSSVTQTDNDMALQAAVFRAASLQSVDIREIDESGRLKIPAENVQNACAELFGSAYRLNQKAPQKETFFTYQDADNTYRVLPQSSSAALDLQITEVRKQNGVLVATVQGTEHTVHYLLQFDALSGKPYLAAVF